jgi:hypothetical protein
MVLRLYGYLADRTKKKMAKKPCRFPRLGRCQKQRRWAGCLASCGLGWKLRLPLHLPRSADGRLDLPHRWGQDQLNLWQALGSLKGTLSCTCGQRN